VEIQNVSNIREFSKPLWEHPWKYRESFLFSFLILVVGSVISVLFRGKGIEPIGAPYNVIIAFVFVSLLLFIHVNYRKRPFVIWLASVPAALNAIVLFTSMVLLLAILPQEVEYKSKFVLLCGLSHVKTSWLFLVTETFFLTTLGMVILKRCFPLNGRNIGFFLNHFGLFLTLLAVTLGGGDIKRLEINLLKEGNESNIGVSAEGVMIKLPFSLRLLDFTIDEYNPRLAIVDVHSGIYKDLKGASFPMIDKDLKVLLDKWQFQVLDFLPHALIVDSTIQNSVESGSFPAANVKAVNTANEYTVIGWISSGSYLQSPISLPLDTSNMLVLTLPEVRKYTSLVEIRTDSLNVDTFALEVNKPYAIKGWKIYQLNYDKSKGKWSSLSILEAVCDPWLKLVYVGIFMVMAGVVYLFWIGSRNKNIYNP